MNIKPLVAAALLTAGSSVSLAPSAAADSSGTWIPYGLTDRCVSDYWLLETPGGVLPVREVTRYVCDQEKQPDGSWERCVSFYAKERWLVNDWVAPDGRYVPGVYLPELNRFSCVQLNPGSVPADEPGWIDPPTGGSPPRNGD